MKKSRVERYHSRLYRKFMAKSWVRWFRSRLYHKLVLSHAALLVVALLLAAIMGGFALRAFAHVLFQTQFSRQSKLLFGYIDSELTRLSRDSSGRRAVPRRPVPTSLPSKQPTSPSTKPSIAGHQQRTKGMAPPVGVSPELWRKWRPALESNITTASRFLVTLVAVTDTKGNCILEAHPPVLLDLMVGRKWPKRKGWHRLFEAPRVVSRWQDGGECHGMQRLEKIRFGTIQAVASYTYQLHGQPAMVFRFYSLSPFRSHPPKGVFFLILVLAFGASMILVFPVNLGIVRPLQQLTTSVKQIQQGMLNQEVHTGGLDEVGQLADAVEEMRQALQEHQQQRQVLLSDISHEIRTPLSRIRTVAESVADGLMREEQRLTQAMDGICKQVDEIDQLMGDLLAIARFSISKANQLEREFFDVRSLLTEMHRALHPAAVGERVELSLQPVPDETLWVWADRRRLRQVINNLVQNAIRHSPTGGTIELSVSVVSGGADGQQVCILVRDEGPGIPVEERERIFERLVRLDPSRNRQSGGQGLGLSIVLQIVEAHGGKVGVTDAPGGGAQFWVRLPMSAAPEEG